MKPICEALTDEDLEGWNAASAAGWRERRGIHVDAAVLNSLSSIQPESTISP